MWKNVRILSYVAAAAILTVACVGEPSITQDESPMNSREACVAKDGIWVPFQNLYPDKELNEIDSARFTCRLPTHEEGKPCSDNRQCKGACVAPLKAISGQEVVGTCSKYQWAVDGTRTVIDGKVSFPMFSLEMTQDKVSRLEELEHNRDKWVSHAIRDYDMKLAQSCFCLFGPYYGPNKVSVRDGRITRVVYLGERRDGYKPGDRLTKKKALKNTIDGIFDDLETTIRHLTSNAALLVEYDEEFGFPKIIDYDRPDMDDEENRLVLTEFERK